MGLWHNHVQSPPDPDGIERKRKRKLLNVTNLMADMNPGGMAPSYPPHLPATLDDDQMDQGGQYSLVCARHFND